MSKVLVTSRFRLVMPPLAGIPRLRSASAVRRIFPLLIGTLLISTATCGQTSKNIVVLHAGWPKLPINELSDEQIEKAFDTANGIHAQIFNEYIDEKRINPNSIEFPELPRRKYFNQNIDLILAIGPPAVDMLFKSETNPWPGVPVVYSVVDYRMLPERLPSNFTGVAAAIDFIGTLEFALRLRPNTEHVFFVVGTSQFEQLMRRAAASEFKRYEGTLDFEYLEGLPLSQLLNRVAQLPPHSIVFYLEMNKDSNGETYVPVHLCPQISLASNSPVYAPHSLMMGLGIVGGESCGLREHGKAGN